MNKENPDDPRFSGNYIITKVRHHVTGEQYKMILECAKDSVATSYQRPFSWSIITWWRTYHK